MTATTPTDPRGIETQPADHLTGLVLPGGWRVLSHMERPPGSTGGTFSIGYLAEGPMGELGFVKALDYSKWRTFAERQVDGLKVMVEAFTFERSVVEKCATRGMKHVIRGLAHGEVAIGRGPFANVDYIIFEVADGDVRGHVSQIQVLDTVWSLRVLHNVANGLRSLHSADIFHQDLKPSNILVFPDVAKLADLGRSYSAEFDCPHSDLLFAGDANYAPPECVYGYHLPDTIVRRRSVDLYHLGSLTSFLFTRTSMTASIFARLPIDFYRPNWGGSYEEVLPHIRSAYDEALADLQSAMPAWLGSDLTAIVQQLCDPEPRLRGDPHRPAGSLSRMSLVRYVSRFDLLARRATIEFRCT